MSVVLAVMKMIDSNVLKDLDHSNISTLAAVKKVFICAMCFAAVDNTCTCAS